MFYTFIFYMKIALLFSEAKPKEGGSRLSSILSLPAFAKGVDIGSSEPEGRWTTGMCGRASERSDHWGRVPDTSRGCSGKGIRRSSWSIPVSSSFKTRWDLPGENIHMRVLETRELRLLLRHMAQRCPWPSGTRSLAGGPGAGSVVLRGRAVGGRLTLPEVTDSRGPAGIASSPRPACPLSPVLTPVAVWLQPA